MKRTLFRVERLSYPFFLPFLVVIWLFSRNFFPYALGLVFAFVALNEFLLYYNLRNCRKTGERICDMLNLTSRQRLSEFPVPVLVTAQNGDVLWYSESFIGASEDSALLALHNVKQLNREILNRPSCEVRFDGRFYQTYRDEATFEKNTVLEVFYLFETTDFHALRREYNLSRPVVAHLFIDNYDEIFAGLKESEKTAVMAEVDEKVFDWAQSAGGVVCHNERDRYLFLFETRALDEYEKTRFDIMDRVRAVKTSRNQSPTISIGIGRGGKGFAETEADARAALDMALSRGGDQAAIKAGKEYTFFGAKSQSGDRLTRIKTRVTAVALSERLKDLRTLVILGHSYGDMDSLGASVGMARIAAEHGVVPRIVVDEETDLTGKLLTDLKNDPAHADWFISPKDAQSWLEEDSAILCVDTHKAEGTTAPWLFDLDVPVFVFDHHRKGVDAIQNPALIYQEPSASSTCEIVTELFRYLNITSLPLTEANALLAGIFLDTKNFTLRTNVYTFDASATLRKMGANPVTVQLYFQTDAETTRTKVSFLAGAELYRKRFAISRKSGDMSGNVRVAMAQAADEMLKIEGAAAAFTLFTDRKGNTTVSARSYGDVNVQVLCERFSNGGGHLTMAGAFVPEKDGDDVLKDLQTYIDEYLDDTEE